VDASCPAAQIALRRVPNIDELLGQSFEFKIIQAFNKRGAAHRRCRAACCSAERKTKRDVPDEEAAGRAGAQRRVKEHPDFARFIDLGGVDGLLHISPT